MGLRESRPPLWIWGATILTLNLTEGNINARKVVVIGAGHSHPDHSWGGLIVVAWPWMRRLSCLRHRRHMREAGGPPPLGGWTWGRIDCHPHALQLQWMGMIIGIVGLGWCLLISHKYRGPQQFLRVEYSTQIYRFNTMGAKEYLQVLAAELSIQPHLEINYLH